MGGDRLIGLALILQRIAKIGECFGQIRLKLDRRAAGRLCLIEPASLFERSAQIVVGVCEIGFEFDCSAVGGDRLIQLPLRPEDHA